MGNNNNRPKENKFKERQDAREAAVRLIYSIDYHPENVQYQVECFMAEDEIAKLSDKAKNYIVEIANGVVDNMSEIDALIEKNSRGWSFNRIPGIDIAVLRLCIYEILFRSDIPASVSINEAVNIAKKYGHDESGVFVNGILGSIYREAIETSRIKADKPRG